MDKHHIKNEFNLEKNELVQTNIVRAIVVFPLEETNIKRKL